MLGKHITGFAYVKVKTLIFMTPLTAADLLRHQQCVLQPIFVVRFCLCLAKYVKYEEIDKCLISITKQKYSAKLHI